MLDQHLARLPGIVLHRIAGDAPGEVGQAQGAVDDHHPLEALLGAAALHHPHLAIGGEARQTRLAGRDAGEVDVPHMAEPGVVDGDQPRRQPGVGGILQAHRGHRMALAALRLVERDTSRRHLGVDEGQRQGAPGVQVHRGRQAPGGGGSALAHLGGSGRRRGGRLDTLRGIGAEGHGGLQAGGAGRGDGALVGAHRGDGIGAHRDLGALGPVARQQALGEGHRGAAGEGQGDIVPVAAAGVLHHRPRLQPGRVVALQQQPVGALPHRGGHHVGERHLALALPVEGDGEAAHLVGAGPGTDRGGLTQPLAQRRVEQFQPGVVAQRQGGHGALGIEQRQGARDATLRVAPLVDAEHPPLQALAGSADAHLDPLQRLGQARHRAEVLGAEGQPTEGLLQGRQAIEAHPLEAAGGVAHHQALEHVVHLLQGHVEMQGAIPLEGGAALHLGKAARGEGDGGHRQPLGLGGGGEGHRGEGDGEGGEAGEGHGEAAGSTLADIPEDHG